MRATRVAASAFLVAMLLVSGCTSGDSPEPWPVRSQEETPPLPPALTAGQPLNLTWPTPNMITPEQRYRRAVMENVRHAAVDSASADIGFKVLLPTYTAGLNLDYLVTTPAESSSVRAFTALYRDNKLSIAEWHGRSILESDLYSANSTISGLPASVVTSVDDGRFGSKRTLADLAWRDGDVNYHLWYEGPVDEAMRVAESIPGR